MSHHPPAAGATATHAAAAHAAAVMPAAAPATFAGSGSLATPLASGLAAGSLPAAAAAARREFRCFRLRLGFGGLGGSADRRSRQK
jgi:hypothetical protein